MWSFSALAFATAGRRVGSVVVNRARLLFAVLLLGLTHWAATGRPFPWDAEPQRFLWLGISGLVGLVIGDSLLFQCYVLVGPRIGVLLQSLSPLFSTLLAWLFLHEQLAAVELAGMAITLAGVVWVVLERGRLHAGTARPRAHGRGIAYGLGAGLCQATNLVIAKPGLADGFPALSATMIRMAAGLVVMWALAFAAGRAGRTVGAMLSDRRAALLTLGGALVGPFVGVWLSMFAVQTIAVGVASTLIAMTPVISLPLVVLVLKEKVSWRAVAGTLVAVGGVAIMMLA